MTDKRELRRQRFLADGLCANCGGLREGMFWHCATCRQRTQARYRQRYRPSMRAAEWTMAMLARVTALELRGVL